MCLSLLQVFKGHRKRTEARRKRRKLGGLWLVHFKCDLGPFGLIETLYRGVSDRIIAVWTLPGEGCA